MATETHTIAKISFFWMWSIWLSIRLTFNSDSMPPSSRGQLQHRSYIELSIHFCVLLKHLSSDAVTKYDRLGGLKNRHLFLAVLRLEVLDQGAGRFSSGWGPSSWLPDGCPLAVPSHGRERALERSVVFLLLLVRALITRGPMLMTSSNYLPKASPPILSH